MSLYLSCISQGSPRNLLSSHVFVKAISNLRNKWPRQTLTKKEDSTNSIAMEASRLFYGSQSYSLSLAILPNDIGYQRNLYTGNLSEVYTDSRAQMKCKPMACNLHIHLTWPCDVPALTSHNAFRCLRPTVIRSAAVLYIWSRHINCPYSINVILAFVPRSLPQTVRNLQGCIKYRLLIVLSGMPFSGGICCIQANVCI